MTNDRLLEKEMSEDELDSISAAGRRVPPAEHGRRFYPVTEGRSSEPEARSR